jgi:hypothetical protein
MYQPKIRDENIRRLYRLKLQRKKPMTRLLDEIINDYFASQEEKVEFKRYEKSNSGR